MGIKVCGIPKQTCSSKDVFCLFQRVAQVRRVQFDADTGQAEVFFFDKFFERNILQMDWSINRSKLSLSKSKIEKDRCKCTREKKKYQTDDNTLHSKYDKYKKGISTFWSNILHENSKPMCKKVRKKRRNWEDFTIKEDINQRNKKKQVRKKKTCLMKAKSGSKKETTLDQEILDSPRTAGKEHGKQDINSKVLSSKESSSTTPVYVMHKNKNTLLNLASPDVLYIKRKIREKLGIPVRLQFLLHKGKLLVSETSVTLEPYDNIHVFIRGRGGMKSEESTESMGACAAPKDSDMGFRITTDSTEDDVIDWIRNRVGLPEEVYKKYEDKLSLIDGNLLLSYHTAEKFASDAQLPVGVARKILYVCNTTDDLSKYNMCNESPCEVNDFISRIKKIGINEEQMDHFHKSVIENYIDGFNFRSYSCEDEFSADFKDLEIPKICFRKIIQYRKKHFPVIKIKDKQKADSFQNNLQRNSDKGAVTEPLDGGVPNLQNNNTNASTCNDARLVRFDNPHTYDRFIVEKLHKTGNEHLPDDHGDFEYGQLQRVEVIYSPASDCIDAQDNVSKIKGNIIKHPGAENDIVNESKTHSDGELQKLDTKQTNLSNHQSYSLENTQCQFEETLLKDAKQGKAGTDSTDMGFNGSVSEKRNEVCNLKDDLLAKGLLQECTDANESTECMIKVVIHCNWENPNDLEKNIIFFVISPSEEFENNNKRKADLWKAIIKRGPVWRKEIHSKEKETVSKQEFTKQCKSLKLLLDVNPESLQRFKNATYIFLVSECLQIERRYIYKTPLSRNSKHGHFYFTFPGNKHHFLYHPEELVKGFRRNVLKDYLCVTRSEEETCNEEDGNSVVVNEEHKTTEATSPISKLKPQAPRKFREDPYAITYTEGHIFSQTEHDGTLAERCIEYKLFEKAQQHSERKYVKYLQEVLRFACGCLNKRQNGTIYFGIGDEKNEEGYRNGEVVGFDIFENGYDTRTKYSDALRRAIQDCFSSADIAKECISNPHFIVTVGEDASELFLKVVMEIDIEPSDEMCGDTAFLVDLSKIQNISLTKKIKEKYVMFLREGSSTRSLENDQEKILFKEIELKKNIKKRKEFETKHYPKPVIKVNLSSKLKHLVTLGDFSHQFDADNSDSNYICPILVAGKPSNDLKGGENFGKDFAFVKYMPFLAVFDFDDFSNKDGLCFHFRVPEQSKFVENNIFQQKTGNLRVLADELNLEYDRKRIWMFANGRADLDIKHLQRREWFSSYYAEISAAVAFLSQPFVIPSNRITFLILLLSTDLDGVIDTFSDIVAKFGWDPITIVPDTEYIFRQFSERVINECKGTKEDLEKHTVLNMPWDHVNRTLLQLSGRGDRSGCLVSSSSGTPMTLSERFIDTCTDLIFLGHNECENVLQNKDEKTRKELEKTQLMQFYRGAKVTWWNIFFDNQVCLRKEYLDNLEERIKDKLENLQNEANVVVMTIAHEAGAGATTLAHQILWIFRKKQVRCCILKQITNFTAAQILRYWKITEDSKPLPVLVLVDDLLQSELSYDTFISNLKVEFRKQSEAHGMHCLVLTCQRENTISGNDRNENNNVFKLRHKLNEKEQRWFYDKFCELEKQRGIDGYDPRYLISFMMMRSGFNRSLIEKTLTYLLYDNNIPIPERELIKYVSFLSAFTPFARRWIKVVIPVECCDHLMTKRFWESKRKSSAFNILLIIEKAEERSEKYVRMGYPAIAFDVLKEIMIKEKITLGKVAKDFFRNFIVPDMTHGGRIRHYTLAMLKERIRRGKDGAKTDFSPLIEKIIESDFDAAIEVINEGFEIFHDAILAQALARLYQKQKRFDRAIEWANESVNFATQQSLSFCLHTYGGILRDKFLYNKQKRYDLGPAANDRLQLVLESLEKFVDAQNKRDRILKTYEAFHDTIFTINMINDFLMSIDHGLDEDSMRKYLVQKEYVPDILKESWKEFHNKLKSMKSDGERALDLLEDKICFYSSFDAQDNEMQLKGHRHNVNLQKNYTNYLTRFIYYYGEDANKRDDSRNPHVQDAYHKARLMTLKGHSYKTIFDHITKIDNGAKRQDTVKCLSEIRTHINAIKDTTSTDLLNKVCVNVALGIAGGHYSKEDDLIAICFNIIERNKEKVKLAYMFLAMLMWPLNEMKATYKDQRFQEALSCLQDNSERPIISKENVQKVNMYLVTEEKISQPTITFFQGNGCGVRSLRHRSTVFMSPEVHNTKSLLRMKGIVKRTKNASLFIVVENDKCKNINIHIFRKKDRELMFGEEVTFFLGFSIAGPVAYDIKHSAFCYS